MKRLLIISALIACVLITGCTSSQIVGKGTLQFSSSPQGAQIYLDNQYQGTTPIPFLAYTPEHTRLNSVIRDTRVYCQYYSHHGFIELLCRVDAACIPDRPAQSGTGIHDNRTGIPAHHNNPAGPDGYDHRQHADVFRDMHGE